MATDNLTDFVNSHAGGASRFEPYYEHSTGADSLTMRFKPDADYSVRLTDHVTIYRSIDTDELVGCRIKGVEQLLEDLPNYIKVDVGTVSASILFLSFRPAIGDKSVRDTLNELARAAQAIKLVAEPVA